jgi:hypothetical protein
MKPRTRYIVGAILVVLGTAVLGYWYYATAVIVGLVHMFEALKMPVETSPEPLIWIVFPYFGVALILAGLFVVFAPIVRRSRDRK